MTFISIQWMKHIKSLHHSVPKCKIQSFRDIDKYNEIFVQQQKQLENVLM